MARRWTPILRNSFVLETVFLGLWLALAPTWAAADPALWGLEFPATDFAKRSIAFSEIRSDGATRDSIPPIDDPKFQPVRDVRDVGPLEPVISVVIGGEARAYPLRILLYHKIVNDIIGGVPVLISYCPLCNSGVVFDRRLDDRILDFGNTGRLRHYDMVMYDRNTESWWQQFLGEAIMGELSGRRLKMIPARLESLQRFQARAPEGSLLIPPRPAARSYGKTPYVRMDSRDGGFPYDLPDGVRSLDRVVVIGDVAWTLKLVRARGRIEHDGLVLTWSPGQNSIHDTKWIPFGRDVGNVIVQLRTDDGGFIDVAYDVAFAFAFVAFRPEGRLIWK